MGLSLIDPHILKLLIKSTKSSIHKPWDDIMHLYILINAHIWSTTWFELIINALIKSNKKIKNWQEENLGIHLINYFELDPHYKCFHLIWFATAICCWFLFVFEYFCIFFVFEYVFLYLAHRAVVDKSVVIMISK